MDNQIFRQKSIDRVSSPEQLNDYIKVSNPTVWIILVAVIILLVGVLAWGILGRLETTINGAVVCQEDGIICYIDEQLAPSVGENMTIYVGENKLKVKSVQPTPISASTLNERLIYLGNFSQDMWLIKVEVEGTLEVGEYQGKIVVDSVSPISFVIN